MRLRCRKVPQSDMFGLMHQVHAICTNFFLDSAFLKVSVRTRASDVDISAIYPFADYRA